MRDCFHVLSRPLAGVSLLLATRDKAQRSRAAAARHTTFKPSRGAHFSPAGWVIPTRPTNHLAAAFLVPVRRIHESLPLQDHEVRATGQAALRKGNYARSRMA